MFDSSGLGSLWAVMPQNRICGCWMEITFEASNRVRSRRDNMQDARTFASSQKNPIHLCWFKLPCKTQATEHCVSGSPLWSHSQRRLITRLANCPHLQIWSVCTQERSTSKYFCGLLTSKNLFNVGPTSMSGRKLFSELFIEAHSPNRFQVLSKSLPMAFRPSARCHWIRLSLHQLGNGRSQVST